MEIPVCNRNDPDNQIMNSLRLVGFDRNDARVYKALVELCEGTVYEISRLSRVGDSRVSYSLNRLETLGIIEISCLDPVRYLALPPQEIFRLGTPKIERGLDLLQFRYNTVHIEKRNYMQGSKIYSRIVNILREKGEITEEKVRAVDKGDFLNAGFEKPHLGALHATQLKILRDLRTGKLKK
jgi:sugar-specific transcriptional regulator TrmB